MLPAVINETIFDKSVPLAGGWVETEGLFLANVKLDAAIFDPHAWKAPGWVGTEGDRGS